MSGPPPAHPDLIVRRIWDVPPQWLMNHDILYQVFDVDGTVGEISCLEAVPDAGHFLRAQLNHGYRLCFATNALRDLSELSKRFDAPIVQPSTTRSGIIGELTKFPKKPSRGFYERVLDELGDPDPASVVMYGDKWKADICGAAQVGMKTILVNNMGADLPWEDRIRFRRRETKAMARHGIIRMGEG